MRLLPRLSRTHPNFFIIYFTIAVVFHLGIGITMFVAPDRYQAPSLDLVYRLAPFQVWGSIHLVVFALMTIGVYHRFNVYARLGLGIGFFLCLTRGLLIEMSSHPPGASVFVWIPMAIQHWVQAAEPTANPLTTRADT